MAAFLGPERGAVKHTADTGRVGVEILRVAHRVAVGILVVRVSARSWI